MKIALIGPAFPYRGGIAHHTNMLARYLRRHGHQVDVITFTRQYPKLLYPGKFQEELGEGGEFADEVNSERMIDSINPITWDRTGQELRHRRYDLHIFKFWIPFFGPSFGSIARRVHRRGNKDVMVVCENFTPHEARPGDRQLRGMLFRYCNMAITQSSVVQKALAEVYPEIPQRLQPHPVYENFGDRLSVGATRAALGITASRVILFFGFVRHYKGLDLLLAAMPEVVRRVPGVHLLVVGEFFGDAEPYHRLIRDLQIEDHITLHSEYVPNEDVAQWFSASDLLVLPYRSATNSGIVQIGYNFATPAVVTNVGSLSEVVIDNYTGFVIEEASPESIASAVERAFQGDTLRRFSENIMNERPKYTWDGFVEGIEILAREVQAD